VTSPRSTPLRPLDPKERSDDRPPAGRIPRRVPSRVAFPLLALILFGLFFAASAPSPLFLVFQREWHFAPASLTLAFAVYALALLATLLIAGSLSDHIGRRPVLMGALLLQTVSVVAFLVADSIGWIIGARIIQGLATGAATGALTAAVTESAPPERRRLGALISGVAPLTGLALGALATGFIVQFSGHPTTVVFASLAVFFALAVPIMFVIPETSTPRPGAWKSLVPRLSIPVRARREFVVSIPVMVASWALGGFYLGLAPAIVRNEFGIDSGLVNGLAIATLFGFGAIASTALGGLAARLTTVLGTATLGLGTTIALISLASDSTLLFFIGTAVAGTGFGAGYTGGIRILAPLADAHQRAELFAAVFVVSYVAFGVPAIVAGQLITPLGLHTTALSYGVLLVAFSVVGLAGHSIAARPRA